MDKALNYFPQKPTSTQIQDEPGTCTEAEPFALRVLDDSMEPEFKRGCIIIIDPTGRATDGSYVLVEGKHDVLFRQLNRVENGWSLNALNGEYPPSYEIDEELRNVLGVIVQRAGARRSYHRRYDSED